MTFLATLMVRFSLPSLDLDLPFLTFLALVLLSFLVFILALVSTLLLVFNRVLFTLARERPTSAVSDH